jgi:NodT family efflux transporter outer membrane factor (OMF) lipoprotein
VPASDYTARPFGQRVSIHETVFGLEAFMRSPVSALFVSTALALVLCACAPDLGPKPEVMNTSEIAADQSLAAPASSWPQEAWWKEYGDPQLDGLIDDALKDAPDLKMAAARVRGMAAMADISESFLWPTVTGSGMLQETKMTQNLGLPEPFKAALPKGYHNAAMVAVGIDYQLDFFGKNHAALNEALSNVEAAKADEAAAQLQISTGVASMYALLQQLFVDQSMADDAVLVRRKSADLVDSRFQRGLENEASRSQALAQLEAAKVHAEAVAAAIAKVQHGLAALIGKGPDYGLKITAAKGRTLRSNGLPGTLAADLIGRRPDLVAARRLTEAASSGIDVANANFYPNVDLTGMAGLGTLDAKYLLKTSSEIASFGPAVHLPIFDYGRKTGIYRAARAKYDAAVALYDRTLTNALRDVADAYSDRRAIEGQLAHGRASLAQSENAYRVINVRYKAGMAPYIDVLTVENLLIQQRTAVADLEAQAFSYDIALVRALGGGYAVKK